MNRTRHVLGPNRPDKTPDGHIIPADWIIYNAPRPLRGALTWTGPFVSGLFYAASPKEDELSAKINTDLDAYILYYASEEDVKNFVKTILAAEYPEVAKLNYEEYRSYFMDRYFFYFNFNEL